LHAWLAFIIGILIIIAGLLLFAAFSGATDFGLAIQVEVTVAVTLIVIALILGLILYAGVKAQFKRVKTGKEALIGAMGTATTDLKPKGEIRVVGEFWKATSRGETINAGQEVKIVGMEGMFLLVESAEQKA
jgi:membrane-bound serine protease (ClpP class)